MFSHPIEIHSKELPKSSEKTRTKTPASFPKKEKSKIPQNLENESLEALKELLSRHKQSNDTAPATNVLPLSERPSLMTISIDAKRSIAEVSSVQWTHFFDQLVKALIHVDKNGIQETTIFLNNKEFSSSIFSGSHITITEFSTAPKVFNVQFQGHQEALALFQAHAADLAQVLNQGKFGFSIGRIDASLSEDYHKEPKISAIERDLEKEKQ